MRTRQGTAFVVATLLVFAGAAACSNDDEPEPTPSPTSTSTPTASSTSSPTPTATSSSTATSNPTVARTTVRLRVIGNGCDDCSFTAYTNVGGVTKKLSTRGWLYSDGGVYWTVPTSSTRNMAFGFDDLPGGLNTVVVTSYQGVAPGTTLTPEQARTKTSASWCWIGTKRSSITLTVRVEEIQVPNTDPDTSASDPFVDFKLVYTSPLVGSTGTFHPTVNGGLSVSGPPKCP